MNQGEKSGRGDRPVIRSMLPRGGFCWYGVADGGGWHQLAFAKRAPVYAGTGTRPGVGAGHTALRSIAKAQDVVVVHLLDFARGSCKRNGVALAV